jgi:hypothetical protein
MRQIYTCAVLVWWPENLIVCTRRACTRALVGVRERLILDLIEWLVATARHSATVHGHRIAHSTLTPPILAHRCHGARCTISEAGEDHTHCRRWHVGRTRRCQCVSDAPARLAVFVPSSSHPLLQVYQRVGLRTMATSASVSLEPRLHAKYNNLPTQFDPTKQGETRHEYDGDAVSRQMPPHTTVLHWQRVDDDRALIFVCRHLFVSSARAASAG